MLENICLVQELKKLKESSNEAVETLDSFSEFKEYMHIKRTIQDELESSIKEACELKGQQLILVCGGVGDGKSHLISYLKDKNPEVFERFELHNDATESEEPTKTAMDTLNEKLLPFSDARIDIKEDYKLIIAINLGTLNNFINSEYSPNYKRLKEYVENNYILESKIHESSFDKSSPFHYVNFSDYHLFSLVKSGVRSEYLSSLIGKVVSPKEENPFYSSYRESCLQCEGNELCPVKYNYEFVMKEENQQKLIELLVEMMIKYKFIISTRSMLNFIYEIIVESSIDALPLNKQINSIKKMGSQERVAALIKTLLFENSKGGKIFEKISQLDPLKKRSEETDEILMLMHTNDDLSKLVDEYLDRKDLFLKRLIVSYGKNNRNDLIKFLIRDINFRKGIQDTLYNDFIRNLYVLNMKEKSPELKSAYDLIKNGIYNWNGSMKEGDRISVFAGKKQMIYQMKQDLELKPYTKDLRGRQEERELEKFIPFMKMSFQTNEGIPHEIELDYFLFELINKITRGYRPNKKDKDNYIKFSNFVDSLSKEGKQNREVYIEDRLNRISFGIKKDEDWEEFTFVE